ncbi:abortive infection system antitoxin AbiGi family protein [Nocardioides sp. NPDC092400]|uniref:abortive infection system antitoxin AbiGi family protein n=1 Tax=Nocardioides sp. NPDC092400 TaxID=3155196 RepID=UPI00341B118D
MGDTQKAACFSEVPLDRLDRLVERRSKYGVAFRQEFLTQRGGARVWYVENDGAVAQSIREMVTARAVPGMDVDDTFWKMTPFFDFPSEAYDYQFEWEREWRVPGGLTFQPADVAFLFIPENLHSAARAFFDDHEAEGTGPSYKCPYLDPLWPDERLQAVFAGAEL